MTDPVTKLGEEEIIEDIKNEHFCTYNTAQMCMFVYMCVEVPNISLTFLNKDDLFPYYLHYSTLQITDYENSSFPTSLTTLNIYRFFLLLPLLPLLLSSLSLFGGDHDSK